MKKIIFLFICFIFVGCSSTRHSVISLPQYVPSNNGFSTQKTVNILSINDKRVNASTVATITNKKGTVSEYVMIEENLVDWFKKALYAELQKSGVVISDSADVNVEIDINELTANLSGYSSDNMKGNCVVSLRFYKDEQTINKKLSGPQTKFVAITTTSAFKPFLNTLLSDMVKRTAKAIING